MGSFLFTASSKLAPVSQPDDVFLQELYIRSRTQEEEILLLRKQIADASLKV